MEDFLEAASKLPIHHWRVSNINKNFLFDLEKGRNYIPRSPVCDIVESERG